MEVRPIGSSVQSAPAPAANKAEPAVGTPIPVAVKPAASPVSLAAVQQPGSVPNMEQVKQAVQEINKAMKSLSQDLEFSIDEDSDRTVVKVVDQQTKEVIRQVPSKEALEIARALDKVQGLLIRQQA